MPGPALIDLLQRGYFPKELPQTFTTEGYGTIVCANEAAFEAVTEPCKSANTCRYQLARPGTLRRAMGLPNPLFQYQLAKEVATNWASIEVHLQRSPLSVSKPITSAAPGRAVQPALAHSELLDRRITLRATHRFILRADISQFYPSLYTHSIPWALHGKQVAKERRRDMTLLGNRLDRFIQQSQDSQTKGIPIGPDTSLVVAEMLLAACDEAMSQQLPNLQGFRYFDDYELCFDSRAKAEEALPILEATLGSYELSLNPLKCKLETVLQPLDSPWARIRRVEVRHTDPTRQRNDLIFLFEEAFELAKLFPTDHVLKYTIGRLENVPIRDENLGLYARLLCQSVMIENAVLPLVLNRLLLSRQQDAVVFDAAVDGHLLAKVLRQHILAHAPAGNSSEVAWAIWGAIAFHLGLDGAATAAICRMEDSAVALLAIAAGHANLLDEPSVDTTWWQSQMTADALLGEHWLLSYEAEAQGWIMRAPPAGPVPADVQGALNAFTFLRDRGVRFYVPSFGHNPQMAHTDWYGDAAADGPA